MTYCVGIQVNDGLVFASDTRTSAGVDDVRTYTKMHAFESPGERVLVILSAGNLATTHTIVANLKRDIANPSAPASLFAVPHMYDAAEYLGTLSARTQRDAATQSQSGVDLRATLILGGQIGSEEPALYLVYPEGNCIASSPETPYLQLGESKYGKPILDRIIRPELSLEDAARCALVSLDSTMKSNISVGPPLDLAILPRAALQITRRLRLDPENSYYTQVRDAWGRHIGDAFRNLPKFEWELPPPG